MNRINSKLFYIFLVFTIVWFDLKAAESVGYFFPFSECTPEQKQIVLSHYNIGTSLDSIITRIPSCDTRNILYTKQNGNNVVVVSGLYPVTIPEIVHDTKIKTSIKIKGLCLPQILLDDITFSNVQEYIDTVNDYEVIKKDLSKIASISLKLNEQAITISAKYHECLTRLSSRFSDYKTAFITYMDKLKEYVEFICGIRKIEDSQAIRSIDDCKTQISKLGAMDIVQIKKLFDEILVDNVKKYAHSETAFLYYCNKTGSPIPSVLFTTRDMCPICEDTIVKTVDKSIIVVSTKEHENSWTRHDIHSKVKKVVIDTDIRFNSLFSSLTDPKKLSELRTECEKVLSPRGVSLLFQQIEIPSNFFQWFSISEEDFSQAVGNETKKIRRNLLAAYARPSKDLCK